MATANAKTEDFQITVQGDQKTQTYIKLINSGVRTTEAGNHFLLFTENRETKIIKIEK